MIFFFQEKILLITKFILFLLACVFISACVTDQFQLPMEIEVMDDAGLPVISPEFENVTVWNFFYKGFSVVRPPTLSLADNIHVLDTINSGGGRKRIKPISWVTIAGQKLNLDIASTAQHAAVHILVDATKFTIVRLLILQVELTVEMFITYYIGS